ncbi:hypothetical protein PPYR_14274 [Photinus pyralis]|uniref:Suppressor of cytokine signaling 5 n=2 Tax=Photinus pyralis TaxID=7054 RepID=A0A5N4A4R9_PHOPY|nr:suppressor of cytokine signaling 5 [Photinus pyralis]XP_031357448.1 suppressor of cytokine signaling 5 [Photinus pyralis]XP_031357449.1 suppressor of cytokine signaling 5 [Photinus pyralis]KAB0792315.1 hypothetical protein PPYR_14274 [Photinus pyralis]
MDVGACSSSNDKCTCEDEKSKSTPLDHNELAPKERKSKISFTSFGLNLRRGRSLNLTGKRSKKSSPLSAPPGGKKSSKWVMKLNCSKKESKGNETPACCQCTCYRRTSEHHAAASPVQVIDEEGAAASPPPISNVVAPAPAPAVVEPQPEEVNEALNRGVYSNSSGNIILSAPFVDIHWIRSIHEDCDEAARIQRAREIEQGVDPPANFRPLRRVQLLYSDIETEGGQAPRRLQLVCPPDLTVESLRAFFQNRITLRSCPLDTITGCHTQVDFIHCLVPDLLNITNCSFYWGKMDRYEAERLLDGKPEGTFLLRDSAQEEFLFSVSFRKYGRSLHARIEQWNHKFSFDSHDPGVYTSDTVCGLIEHYKDPSSCMFFEPMLTWPLHRNFTFSLQHLCRAVVVSKLEYDNINQLHLPKSLKSYLKEYHYRQKVRVERFDDDVQWLDLRNVPP